MTPCYPPQELAALAARGVLLPAPHLVAIERDLPLEQIAPGAVLYPFCRLAGASTRIDAGAHIGPGGPATVVESWVGAGARIGTLGPVTLLRTTAGPGTVLGCGEAEDAVFLGKETQDTPFTTGHGFRARHGTLFEEDASCAQHSETKMTVLLPWVTLGSNIVWCDVLVAGGTGPGLGAFTEIGSGAVHFNFTPRGDKATASALGNAVAGVFLDQPRLFIGGNGSLIGPVQADFGALTLAGGRYAGHLTPGLNVPQAPEGRGVNLEEYGSIRRVVTSQVRFIADLAALAAWYDQVRDVVALGQPERAALYRRGRAAVQANIQERIQQLHLLAQRMESSAARIQAHHATDPRIAQQRAFARAWPRWQAHLSAWEACLTPAPALLIQSLHAVLDQGAPAYTQAIRSLPPGAGHAGRGWLHALHARVAPPELLAEIPTIPPAPHPAAH